MSPNLIKSFPSQQCMYASLVKIHSLDQKIMNENETTQQPAWTQAGSAPIQIYSPLDWGWGHKHQFAYICKFGVCSHDIYTYKFAHGV